MHGRPKTPTRERIVAQARTSVISGRESAAIEPAVLDFLNSSAVLRRAEVTLGL
jgi:hypothetical protein